jgi:Zn-finger nucleic acid-binding protein
MLVSHALTRRKDRWDNADVTMPGKPQSTTTNRSRKKVAGSADFEKARKRLDRKRAQRRQKMLWAHYWLLCPKCGGDMFVQRTSGIVYEVCRDCHGIAIDGEELGLLLENLDAAPTLRAILKQSKKPDTTEI